MKIIDTSIVEESDLSAWERSQVYNGLDCAITAEVLDVIRPQLDNLTQRTYEFSKALQGPVLEMRCRGVKIDAYRRSEVLEEFHDKLDRLEEQLNLIAHEGVGMLTFNWRSNDDLKTLFYERLRIPAIRAHGHVSVDRNALEKLEAYTIARQIVRHLTALREIGKKIGFLKTAIDPDGRVRTSYNIAGTNTGRFSSSVSEFGTGTNLQNVEESLRSIFIADKGMKFAKFDAKSGESYVVGAIEWNLFGDGRYLDAVESGDIHTAVAKLCWPKLPWTGNLKADKAVAETLFYRHYSHRFMCKKLSHGSNYGGQAQTLATQTKLPVGIVQGFQPLYFRAFPAHLLWHGYVENELYKRGFLISLMGRKRYFMGRRNSPDTLREAIAYDPQGSLADIVNEGMLNTWNAHIVTLMMHDHDALTFQYPEAIEDKVIPQIHKLLRRPVVLAKGRILEIPYDCKVGWNKGEWGESNPDGLKDYEGTDQRKRSAEVSFLDRRFH